MTDITLESWLSEVENFGLRQERLVEDTGAPLDKLLPWLHAAFALGRQSQERAVSETYTDLCDLHIFLQGFDSDEAGALEEAYDTLVDRVRDNALALEPLLGEPGASPPSGWTIIESDSDYLTIRDDETDREIVVDTRMVLRAQTLSPADLEAKFRAEHLTDAVYNAMLPEWRNGVHQKAALSNVARKVAERVIETLEEEVKRRDD